MSVPPPDLAVIAAKIAAAAPPLTSEQADRVAAFLRGDVR